MLDEAKNINKSLSSLGNVISALAEGTVSNSDLTLFSRGDFSVVSLNLFESLDPFVGYFVVLFCF